MTNNRHLGKTAIIVGAPAEGTGKTAEGPGANRAEVSI
jgi:crotonyl-CoA carboxylase/reductase